MNIRRILIPTDFSRNAQLAFNAAYHLARATGAELYVLHVQAEGTVRTAVKEGLLKTTSTTTELKEALEELQDARFSELMAGTGTDVRVRCFTTRGAPQSAIADFALASEVDLLVVGLRGTSVVDALRSKLLGSVAEAMIEKSPCPVLVVRPDHNITL